MDSSEQSISNEYPSGPALISAAKLSCTEDKPIMLDYWKASIDGQVIIGIKDDEDKLLVKSQDEYTSPIAKVYKAHGSYIIMTENSIYIVSANTQARKISNLS